MRRIAKRLGRLILMMALLSLEGWAAPVVVVVGIAPGTNIQTVADAYNGKILSVLDSSTYMLQINQTTPKYPVAGVLWMESNSPIPSSLQHTKGAVVSVGSQTSSDWYVKQPNFELIHRTAALQLSNGSGIIIADINSMVDYSHPSLKGHLIAGWDFVLGQPSNVTLNQASASFLDQSGASFLDQSSASFLDQSNASFLDQSSASFLDQSSASFLDASNPAHGHGTMVAGILAGIAPKAMIMPIRAFDDSGQSDDYTISKAIMWAVDHNANVINMSFGTPTHSNTMQSAINYANKHGVILISSAGNDSSQNPQFPANYGQVLAVAATDVFDVRGSFSNFGGPVDVTAPGVSIIVPFPGGYYAIVSGTSFSAPIVSGEAALILAVSPNQNVGNVIESTTVNVNQRNPGVGLGKGRVDLTLALASVANQNQTNSGGSNPGTSTTPQVLLNGNNCNGIFFGAFKGNITVSTGQSCTLQNATIYGTVQANGGRLILAGTIVIGNIQVSNAATFSIGGSSVVNGTIQIQNLQASTSVNQVCGVTVLGDVQFLSNAAPVQIGANALAGCAGNIIGGNLVVNNNAAPTQIFNNSVNGDLDDNSNAGPTQVFGNTVLGVLQCKQNSSITGSANVASQKQGQCVPF